MSLTQGERVLYEGIQRAQRIIEDAVGIKSCLLQIDANVPKRVWRALEDALIAFSRLRESCPNCGAYLDDSGDCPDSECPWMPERSEVSHG